MDREPRIVRLQINYSNPLNPPTVSDCIASFVYFIYLRFAFLCVDLSLSYIQLDEIIPKWLCSTDKNWRKKFCREDVLEKLPCKSFMIYLNRERIVKVLQIHAKREWIFDPHRKPIWSDCEAETAFFVLTLFRLYALLDTWLWKFNFGFMLTEEFISLTRTKSRNSQYWHSCAKISSYLRPYSKFSIISSSWHFIRIYSVDPRIILPRLNSDPLIQQLLAGNVFCLRTVLLFTLLIYSVTSPT